MTRAGDFVLWTIMTLFSSVMHLVGIELFKPSSPLHAIASEGTRFNGAAHADQWFGILSTWVPLMVVVGMTVYVIVREYRRQAVAAPTRAP